MSKSKKSNRSWWRELFVDHPGLADKHPNAFVKSESGATKVGKVYCIACFPLDIDGVIEADIRAVTEGRLTTVRNEVEIEAYRELTNWFI